MKKIALNNSHEKKKSHNAMLSLYITTGVNAIKLFNESGNDAARKVIEDSARNKKSFSKKEQLEKYYV